MSIVVGLRASYVALTLSLMALAALIIAGLMHHEFSPSVAKALQMASMMWPLALFAAAVYRRRLKADEAAKTS